MGGGKGGSQTSTITIPPEVLKRYREVNKRAERAADVPFQKYGGQFVAGINANQQAGIDATNRAAGMGQDYYNQARGLLQAGAGSATPGELNIDKYLNPYTKNVVEATQRTQQQQNQQQAQQLAGNAISQGAFGGDRAGISQANLAGQQSLANQQVLAGLQQQGYSQALGAAQQQQGLSYQARAADLARQGQAGQAIAGLGAQAQTSALQGAQQQIGAGTLEQQTQQAGLSALYNQFLQEQGFPYQQAQFLAGIAEGTGALSGSSTTGQAPGGAFSDRRLKDDVEVIGKTFDGQPIYKYKYKGDNHTQIGLMAQDVERRHPEAVGLAAGYKTVDYDQATKGAASRGHFYRGGLATSQGGHVYPNHMGEGYAAGGSPIGGDIYDILAANKAMFPYQQAGMYGIQPGVGPHGIALPQQDIGDLVRAFDSRKAELPKQQPSGINQALDTASRIKSTYDTGKSIYSGGNEALFGSAPSETPSGKPIKGTSGLIGTEGPKPSFGKRALDYLSGSEAPAKTSQVPEGLVGHAVTQDLPSSAAGAGTGIRFLESGSGAANTAADLGSSAASGVSAASDLASSASSGATAASSLAQSSPEWLSSLGSLFAARGGRIHRAEGGGLGAGDPYASADPYLPPDVTKDSDKAHKLDTGPGLTPQGPKGPGVLGGAASGASMGAMVGGPWGAAIGGVLGGVYGAVSQKNGGAVNARATGGLVGRHGYDIGGTPSEDAYDERLRQAVEEGNPTGFGPALERVMKVEGGLNPNDAGAGLTNKGINQRANPSVDVRGLTDEQAREVYRDKYWKQAGITSDMSPAMQNVAFDTSVLMGPGPAKELLGKSGGDAGQMLRLRDAQLKQIAATNPEKAAYGKPWSNRTEDLANEFGLTRNAPEGSLLGESLVGKPPSIEETQALDLARKVASQGANTTIAAPAAASQGRQQRPLGYPLRDANWMERNQDWVLPAVTGIGSMLASRDPTLLGAIGEGLVGAASGYGGGQTRLSEMEERGVNTAQTLAETAGNALQEKGGMLFVTGLTPDGKYEQVPYWDWLDADPDTRLKLDPRTEVAAQKVAEKYPRKPVAAVAPINPSSPVQLTDNMANLVKGRAALVSRMPTSERENEPDVFTPQEARGMQARNDQSGLVELTSTLSGIPRKESLVSSGALNGVTSKLAAYLTNIARSAGLNYVVNPEDLANGQLVNKITSQLKNQTVGELGQTALGAITEIGQAFPSMANEPGAQAKMAALLLRTNMREIDKNQVFQQALRTAEQEPSGPLSGRRSGRGLHEAFDQAYGPAYYGPQEKALEQMFNEGPTDRNNNHLGPDLNPVKEGEQGLTWMQYLRQHGNDLRPEERAAIEQKFGKGILRYYGL